MVARSPDASPGPNGARSPLALPSSAGAELDAASAAEIAETTRRALSIRLRADGTPEQEEQRIAREAEEVEQLSLETEPLLCEILGKGDSGSGGGGGGRGGRGGGGGGAGSGSSFAAEIKQLLSDQSRATAAMMQRLGTIELAQSQQSRTTAGVNRRMDEIAERLASLDSFCRGATAKSPRGP